MKLRDFLASTFLPRRSKIDDITDVGADFTLSNGVTVPYPISNISRRYNPLNSPLIDPATSRISNGILDARLLVKWTFTLNGAQNHEVQMNITCPNNGFPFDVFKNTYTIETGGTDQEYSNTTAVYIGPEVLEYGLEATVTAVGGDVTIKGRSLLVME